MNAPLATHDMNPRSCKGFVDARASLRNHMWVFVSRPVGGRGKLRNSLHVVQDSHEGKERNLNDAAMFSERRRDEKEGGDKVLRVAQKNLVAHCSVATVQVRIICGCLFPCFHVHRRQTRSYSEKSK